MDFIIKPSKTKNLIIKKEYNKILIIIDGFIKYFYIILFKKKYIAKQLRIVILDRLI